MNRRIRKTVYEWDEDLNGGSGGWDTANPVTDRKFMYADRLLLMELDCGTGFQPVDTVLRTYTWGLDLAGLRGGQSSGLSTLEDAGGIGGVRDTLGGGFVRGAGVPVALTPRRRVHR